MIVFDLRCAAHGHVFESWFASSSAYEDLRARRLVECPFCGDTDIAKAVMAPNVAAKGNRRSQTSAPRAEAPEQPVSSEPVAMSNSTDNIAAKAQALIGALARAQAKALENSSWVGRDFADRARAMHYGEESHAPIHGEASPQEARALEEEGVKVSPLPFPVIAPDAKN